MFKMKSLNYLLSMDMMRNNRNTCDICQPWLRQVMCISLAWSGDICLEDVYFSYPLRPDVEVLGGLNLTLKSGTVTALVGPSGVGKSTVVQLLARFYEPTIGRITVAGEDIRTFDKSEWARVVSIVNQDPVLFSVSVAENIAYALMLMCCFILRVGVILSFPGQAADVSFGSQAIRAIAAPAVDEKKGMDLYLLLRDELEAETILKRLAVEKPIVGPANALLEGNLANDQQGLTPRVFERLFARINEEQIKDAHRQLKYQFRCSFLEIYNEQITDLLDPRQNNLQIREDTKTGVYVENLTEECVSTMKDVIQLLLKRVASWESYKIYFHFYTVKQWHCENFQETAHMHSLQSIDQRRLQIYVTGLVYKWRKSQAYY